MAKFFLYIFLVFALILAVEFFGIYDIPYLEFPDWVSGTEELLQRNTKEADKIQ